MGNASPSGLFSTSLLNPHGFIFSLSFLYILERAEFGLKRKGRDFSEMNSLEVTQYTLNVAKYLLEYAKTHLNTFFRSKMPRFCPNPYLFCLKALVFP